MLQGKANGQELKMKPVLVPGFFFFMELFGSEIPNWPASGVLPGHPVPQMGTAHMSMLP